MKEMCKVYMPLLKGIARRISSRDLELREELVQEGFIKLLTIKEKNPTADMLSSEWRAKSCVYVKNAMLDHLRKKLCYTKTFIPMDSDFLYGDQTIDPRCTFQALAIRYSLEELEHLLSDIERRILAEIVNPSDDFRMFVRQKRAIRHIASRHFVFQTSSEQRFECDDETLAQYLGLRMSQFKQYMRNIQYFAARRLQH